MRNHKEDVGSASVEYALLAIFIAVAAVAGMVLLGSTVLGFFDLAQDAIPQGTNP